jgi:iron complex transport system ATP-binding protein
MRKIAQAGTCIVLVTHHLPDIIPEIERVILMKAGRIFRDGPKHEMLNSEALSALFEMPLDVLEKDGCYHLM